MKKKIFRTNNRYVLRYVLRLRTTMREKWSCFIHEKDHTWRLRRFKMPVFSAVYLNMTAFERKRLLWQILFILFQKILKPIVPRLKCATIVIYMLARIYLWTWNAKMFEFSDHAKVTCHSQLILSFTRIVRAVWYYVSARSAASNKMMLLWPSFK